MIEQQYFNRFELKYIISIFKTNSLIKQIKQYSTLDKNSYTENGYYVNSLYFDTKDLDFYFEKIDGQKNRKKLRYRAYSNSKNNFIDKNGFIEIKKKINNNVVKVRKKMNFNDFNELFYMQNSLLYKFNTNNFDASFTHMFDYYELFPIVFIRYKRIAFYDKYNENVRITFDFDLESSKCEQQKWNWKENKSIMNKHLSVLEIKFNETIPIWLINIIQKNNLSLQKVSKYCLGIDSFNLI